MKTKSRTIAFYLPQFYPIPENDEWWEKGFTEWTNVTKAKPLFPGHHQPNLPSELGFYDLRVPEVREDQAKLAKDHGIEGFCYWHYWFGNGKRILEKVFKEVVESKKPDFPFCVAWANETWKGVWHGLDNQILAEQTYPGVEDYTAHFYELLPAFKDSRYIRVNNKPLFVIYKAFDIPDVKAFLDLWTQLAKENGLEGIYFVGHLFDFRRYQEMLDLGLDAVNVVRMNEVQRQLPKPSLTLKEKLEYKLKKYATDIPRYEYKDAIKVLLGEESRNKDVSPTLFPNWDHSPRSKGKTLVLHDSNPALFREHVKYALDLVKDKPEEERIIFIKSWNEWAEGNYMEPDRRYGRQYLEVFKDENTY
ncbi:glycosyltransferase WbsX family protein [Chryseobacterium kwangjuense]|uniref:Lipopolysaccharide biosynthesis protein n=1 Tax=Chryseobacterium kwangjuense TaxID=267125 RepID=A0A135WDM1_9FLAO|nr:glycoside hydrolase family 99-like domain-containing protein [Chryseobacterium kwangjuense]KXH83006.1 lipopolysaccharide biosynthesis protein [Chryseobacterium kwangjuense]